MSSEGKHDVLLKRIQIVLAICAALISASVGIYNFKKISRSPEDAPPGGLSFTVRSSSTGQPVSLARVDLLNGQNALIHSGQSNPDGYFAQSELPPGPYSVKVSAVGYEPEVTPILVHSKKTTDFQVELTALPGQAPGGQIRSALEEVGADWIRKIGKSKADSGSVDAAKS